MNTGLPGDQKKEGLLVGLDAPLFRKKDLHKHMTSLQDIRKHTYHFRVTFPKKKKIKYRAKLDFSISSFSNAFPSPVDLDDEDPDS